MIEPDFAAVFPKPGDDVLTARTASALYGALCLLADNAYDDVEERIDTPVTIDNRNRWMLFGDLPPATWQMRAQWRRDLARAADDLAGDLARGQRPQPRCPGEEAMLILAVELARDSVNDGWAVGVDELPATDQDFEWERLTEILFEDLDIELVLDGGWADGIEDPDSDLNKQIGIGDYRPAAWFHPFDHLPERNSDRGYRR